MNKLNDLVRSYQSTRLDETFTEIYHIVSKHWRNLNSVAKSIKADVHEVTEVYHTTLMKCVDEYDDNDGQADFLIYYLTAARNGRADLYRKKTAKKETNIWYVSTDNRDDTVAATIENLPSEHTTDEIVLSKRRADQRHLIDFLLSGADETTTAIVEKILSDERLLPSVNYAEIARELNLKHRSVVYRKLEKLAGKFDSKKHGDYRDFLVAI